MLHPRVMLSSAAQIVYNAAQAGKTAIDGDIVNSSLNTKAVIQTSDVAEGIEGAL